MKKISIIGTGYVGFPTALILAEKNFDIQCVDIDQFKIENLKIGKSFINEKNVTRLFDKIRKKKNIQFSTTIQKSDVYIISVPSDVSSKKKHLVKPLFDVIKKLINLLKFKDCIIIETTSEIGITKKINEYIQKRRSDLFDKKKNPLFYLSYCPERIFPGNILYELKHNPRIIGGINKKSAIETSKIFKKFNKNVFLTDSKTAELTKLAENSFRNVNIGFANELSLISKKLGVDFNELKFLSNLHPRVNILNAGIGVGGHCIPIDPWFLVSKFKFKSSIIRASLNQNLFKTKKILDEILNNYINKKILIWGVTYKENVNDTRNSPAAYIVKKLIDKNIKPKIFDNVIEKNNSFKEKYNNFFISKPEKYINNHINILLVKHKKFEIYKKKLSRNKFHDLCGLINENTNNIR